MCGSWQHCMHETERRAHGMMQVAQSVPQPHHPGTQPGVDPYAYTTRDFSTTHSRDTLSTLDVQLSSPSVQSSWTRHAAHAPTHRPLPTPLPKPSSTIAQAGQPCAPLKLQFGTHTANPKQAHQQQSEPSSEDASTVTLARDSSSQQTSDNSRSRATEEASSHDSAPTPLHADSAPKPPPPQLGTGVYMAEQQPVVQHAPVAQKTTTMQQHMRQASTAVAKARPQPPSGHPQFMEWRSGQPQVAGGPLQQRPQPQHFKRAHGNWHSGKQAHHAVPAKAPMLVTPAGADRRMVAAATSGSTQSGSLPDSSQLPGAVPSRGARQDSKGQQWVVQQRIAQGVAECHVQPVRKPAPAAKAMRAAATAAPARQPAKPPQPAMQPKVAQMAGAPSTVGLQPQSTPEQSTAATAELSTQIGQRKLRGNATQRRKARQKQQPAAAPIAMMSPAAAESGSMPAAQGVPTHAGPAEKKASAKGGRATGSKVWVPKLPAAQAQGQAAPEPAVANSNVSSEEQVALFEAKLTAAEQCKTPRLMPDEDGDKPQEPGSIGAWRPGDAASEEQAPGAQGEDSSLAPLPILKPVKVAITPAAASGEDLQDTAATGATSMPSASLLSILKPKTAGSSPAAATGGQDTPAGAAAAANSAPRAHSSGTGVAVWIRAGTPQGPLRHSRAPSPALGSRPVFWLHVQQARAAQGGHPESPGTPVETGTPLGSCFSLDQSFTDAGADSRCLSCFLIGNILCC